MGEQAQQIFKAPKQRPKKAGVAVESDEEEPAVKIQKTKPGKGYSKTDNTVVPQAWVFLPAADLISFSTAQSV